jgi:hypothetical protein
MSRKGYSLEHEVEDIFLKLAGQQREIPLSERTFRVPQSGSIRGLKGDILTNVPFLPFQFLIECKSRRTKSAKNDFIFRLDTSWLSKVSQEADSVERVPLLVFSFKGAKVDRLWCCIRKSDYEKVFGDKIDRVYEVKRSKKSFILNKSTLKEFSACNDFIILKLPTLISKLKEKYEP